MARRYTLDTKIDALNQLDQHDGDILLTSEKLNIPARTLKRWVKQEDDLRDRYNSKRRRYLSRLKADLQSDMLERGLAIVAKMDDEVLDKAPLNQLASALGALVNHAQKLEEVIDETDEQEENERVIRFEYYYDGAVQDVPPWTGASEGQPRALQSSGLRETMGQNRTGENSSSGERDRAEETWLVARPDLSDVESTLEEYENLSERADERDWYHD